MDYHYGGHGHGYAAQPQPGYPPFNQYPDPQRQPPPPLQQGGYQQYQAPVAPQPVPALDPFRADYATRLRLLTFNSRPIIQDLSLIAMDQRNKGNWDRMHAVVEEIEAALLRAPPDCKLPLLYLVDSISKNIGAPYTTHLLPPLIPRMYQKTYREVDGVTKSRMEEMVKLWRNSGPDGRDLYGPGVRAAIERDIIGSLSGPSRQTVLQTLHSTLSAKQRDMAARPWDETLRHQIGVLQQIADLLNATQVSPPELQRIMDQLQTMAPTPVPLQAPLQAPTPAFPPFPASSAALAPPPSMPPMAPTLAVRSPVPGSTTPIPTAPAIVAPAPIPAGIPTNVADILRNLGQSGILTHSSTPEPASAPTAPRSKNGLEAYEDMILSLDVRLESLDMNMMNALPTAHLPQRCKQCGIRFPEGDAKMQAHMDWHFRRNRNERESQGRGAHRRWLPTANEWIADAIGVNADAGPSSTAAQPSGATPAAASKLSAEKMASYARRWVRVPSDSAKAAKPCPVCKEAFKSEWSEDEEEWIWKNAIDVGGTIYHATCRAEQMAARMAAKMLNPDRRSTSKSPRITPGLEDPTAFAANAKRKAEENGAEVKRVKVEPPETGAEAGAETETLVLATSAPDTVKEEPTEQGAPVDRSILDQANENGNETGQVIGHVALVKQEASEQDEISRASSVPIPDAPPVVDAGVQAQEQMEEVQPPEQGQEAQVPLQLEAAAGTASARDGVRPALPGDTHGLSH